MIMYTVEARVWRGNEARVLVRRVEAESAADAEGQVEERLDDDGETVLWLRTTAGRL